MGVKDTLNNSTDFVSLIISEDRHDLSNFLYQVDEYNNSGLLNDDDFFLFRNGYAIETVLGIKKYVKRDLQPSEILDKINYLSLVPDTESLIKTFTNKELLEGVKDGDRDLSYWFNCGTLESLPIEVRSNIASKLLEIGEVDKAKKVINSINDTLKNEREMDKERKTK